MKKIFPVFIVFLIISCAANHKLTTAKSIRVTDHSVFTVDTVTPTQYILYYSFDTYKTAMIEELKVRLKENNFIVVDTGVQMTDYTLILNKFNYKESIENHVITDTASSYYGQSFTLRVCYIGSETTLYNSNVVKIEDFSLSNFSEEEVSNQRTLFDYIFHTNKDYHDYHQKRLVSNIFEYVAKGNGKTNAKAVGKRLHEIEKNKTSF